MQFFLSYQLLPASHLCSRAIPPLVQRDSANSKKTWICTSFQLSFLVTVCCMMGGNFCCKLLGIHVLCISLRLNFVFGKQDNNVFSSLPYHCIAVVRKWVTIQLFCLSLVSVSLLWLPLWVLCMVVQKYTVYQVCQVSYVTICKWSREREWLG